MQYNVTLCKLIVRYKIEFTKRVLQNLYNNIYIY